MKKLLIVAAFAVAASLATSFGSGRIEIRTHPAYDQQRDQQWLQSQQNQQKEQQQREEWQRAQWQRDQQQQKQRHEQQQSYQWWVQHHQHDYDRR